MTAATPSIVEAKQAAEVGAMIAGLDEAILSAEHSKSHWTIDRGRNTWYVRVYLDVADTRFPQTGDFATPRSVDVFPIDPDGGHPGFRVLRVQAKSLRQALIDAIEFWLSFVGDGAEALPRLRLVVPA